MEEEASKILLDIAGTFFEIVERANPSWEKAYYRFFLKPFEHGSNSSYIAAGKVELIAPSQHRDALAQLRELGTQLFSKLNMQTGVFLLTIEEGGKYNIEFEHDDMNRWRITKMDGGTGIPVGK